MSGLLDNNHGMYVISPVGNIQDTMSEASSLDGTGMFNDNNAIMNPITDEVTAQLANAGPAGVAAAAAISTRKNRKRPHSFEINPSIRKRQQTRLLRKLLATLSEYTTRVGQQAVILCCTPGKSQNPMYFRVFGSQPLETVMKSQKSNILSELDQKLALQAPCKTSVEDGTKHELPLPNVDGIPTPIDKMTQAQLRMFIPEMLKFSTCRSKPGWNKPEYKPPWWPDEAPWANVRCDMRTDEQKKQMSWTDVLRNIVLSCYNYHGRQDLLPSFKDDSTSDEQSLNDNNTNMSDGVNQVMHNSNNSYELSVIDGNGQQPQTLNLWQTLSEGGLSLVHLDSTCTDASLLQLVTFPDGSQAHVLNSSHTGDGSNTTVDGYSDPSLSGTDEVQLLIKSESGYQLIPIYQQPSQLEIPQSSELLIKPNLQYSQVQEAASTSIENVVLQSHEPTGNAKCNFISTSASRPANKPPRFSALPMKTNPLMKIKFERKANGNLNACQTAPAAGDIVFVHGYFLSCCLGEKYISNMESDLTAQTEAMLQRVFCEKLSEGDRNLVQNWLTSKLTIERCGWKKKLQDALKMVDAERRKCVDANAFIARLYVDMVKILPPYLRIRSGKKSHAESMEEFVDLRSYRLKEVQCMWKTISRIFQSRFSAETEINLNTHESRSDFQIRVDDSRGRGTHLELISPVPFPQDIGSPKLQTQIKQISSLDAPQIGHSLLSNSRPPLSKSFSLTCPESDQSVETVETQVARLSITSITPLPKVDVDAAFTAPNQGLVRQKRLEGFTFFTNSESNSSAESYYGEKGQLSDIDRPRNTVTESSTAIRERFAFDSNFNAEAGSLLRIETANGCPSTASSYKSTRVQKKLLFKSEPNNTATDSFKVLRKKRTRFKKSGKNMQS